jgi:hypothetical protein
MERLYTPSFARPESAYVPRAHAEE